jgi:naphthalene 1,2-dioxygenase ferredoxin reductase component
VPRVTVANLPAAFDVRRGTILQAALDAGLPFPHNCRSGNCGSCKSRLLEGRVDMLPHAREALNAAERSSGLVLACRARPKTDLTIEWLGEAEEALPPVRRLAATVCGLERLTGDISRLRLEVQGPPLFFLPGQYVDLCVDGRRPRPYSMANPPDDPILEFHIRHLPNGAASGYVAHHLRIGDPVRLEGPFGSAYLRPDDGPILAIAGGSGLAPIRSIVLSAVQRRDERPIALYVGARDEPDLYDLDRLQGLAAGHQGLCFTPVLSEPSGPTARRTGLVHEAVAADLASLDGYAVHMAGPPAMVEAARALVLERGADARRVFADPFLPFREDSGGSRWLDPLVRWFRASDSLANPTRR